MRKQHSRPATRRHHHFGVPVMPIAKPRLGLAKVANWRKTLSQQAGHPVDVSLTKLIQCLLDIMFKHIITTRKTPQ
jgi:hypothetical protein